MAIVGCGGNHPQLAVVRGTVTLDSRPLVGATVVFQPLEGKVSRAVTDGQGKYELTYLRDIKGARLGAHKVAITTADEHSPRELLPARYNKQTTLTAQVESGSNELDFDLNSNQQR